MLRRLRQALCPFWQIVFASREPRPSENHFLHPELAFPHLTAVICRKAVPFRTGLIGCVLGCLLIPSAPAQKVKIEFDPSADFSRIRQYQWRTHPVFEKNPELKEVYATGIQLVLEAGNQQLMKRGIQPADVSPDVFVTFFLHANAGQSIRIVDSGAYGWYGWYGSPSWTTTEIDSYLEGMLVIDIVDARTSALLWRAYCGDRIRDMRTRDKNIASAVKKALERFPPKQK